MTREDLEDGGVRGEVGLEDEGGEVEGQEE